MNPKPDDFDKVQKLLALKRHEQPPPRFFSEFSEQVIARLDSPVPARPGRWWQRLGLDFDLQPPLVCALGVVVCGLLLVGIITSLDHEGPALVIVRPISGNALVLTPPGSAAVAPATTLNPIAKPEDIAGSTEPIVSSSGSPFNQFTLRTQPAGATVGGN